jgi:hypothetical protein
MRSDSVFPAVDLVSLRGTSPVIITETFIEEFNPLHDQFYEFSVCDLLQ